MVTRFLIRFHAAALAAAMLLTAASVVLLATRGLHRDYTLEAFVSDDSEAYGDFRAMMDEFVSNELAVIAVHTADATSETTMTLVRDLVSRVSGLAPVERVVSAADVPELVRRLLGDRLWDHPLFADVLMSRDRRTTAIVMQMAGEGGSGAQRKATVARLKAIVAEARMAHPDARILLAGPYVTLIDMYDYVNRDLLNFSVAAFALVVVTLGVVFRRLAPMLFGLVVAGCATLCTLGVCSALSVPSTLITQMVVILLMILSVANCVHLASADDEVFERTPFLEPLERARRVLDRMSGPCAAVMITTAVGFGSVAVSGITPIRTFALVMVGGLMGSLVLSLFAVVGLARMRAPSAGVHLVQSLRGALRALAPWVLHRRWRLIGASALIVVCFAVALPWLRFESDFVKNFRKGTTVRRSYEFIAEHLAPTGSMEIVVRRRDGGSMLSADAVKALHGAGERVVSDFDAIKKALTVADLLTLGPAGVPRTDTGLRARLRIVGRLMGEDAVRNFLNDDRTALRMNLRVVEGVGVQQKLEIGHQVRELVAGALGRGYTTTVTGLYYFYATLVSQLWQDQFRSLGITVAAVLGVLCVVLRSLRVALVAMVPTLLPIVFCLGAMAWFGIPVNMTTAMMLSVTTGIAVDDVVHYLWRFGSAYAASGDDALAMRDAHGGVGRACVFTTVVIACGFWILTLSNFLPTAYFGGLLGFTMCWALAADLLLLPALLMVARPFAPSRASA